MFSVFLYTKSDCSVFGTSLFLCLNTSLKSPRKYKNIFIKKSQCHLGALRPYSNPPDKTTPYNKVSARFENTKFKNYTKKLERNIRKSAMIPEWKFLSNVEIINLTFSLPNKLTDKRILSTLK